ncbi:MAG: hypothetical protein ACOCRK_00755 [bacterium]
MKSLFANTGTHYLNEDAVLVDLDAQLEADERMSKMKRRPMVFEYYLDQENPVSVEMYINPERMQFSAQKVIGKTLTRGGIFYHHWGEDHPILQLSGKTGLSGMKGIQQLQKIYNYSGTLLKYQDVGINYGDPNFQPKYEETSRNEIMEIAKQQNLGASSQVMQSLTSYGTFYGLMKNFETSQKNLLDLDDSIQSYFDIYIKLQNYNNNSNNNGQITRDQLKHRAQEITREEFKDKNLDNTILVNIANEITNAVHNPDPYRNIASNDWEQASSNYMINQKNNIKKQRIKQLKETYKELMDYVAIQRDLAAKGWDDIEDEILDEWRPRQVFIYFENRVYIGHFSNFSWNRVAQHPLIQYEIRFTVIREIILSSIKGSTNDTE